MNARPSSLSGRRNVLRVLPAFLLAFLLQACSKESLVMSPALAPAPILGPIPVGPIILYPTQAPLQSFVTKYDVAPTTNNSIIGLSGGGLDVTTRTGVIYNQAEIGFAFRSSVAGVAISLGTLLPTTGFIHTVTLWDSATKTVLGSVNVDNLSTSKFTYADFSRTVPIQANHGYVVGYNTLASGNTVNTYSPGNWIFLVSGIFVDDYQDLDLPLLPYTSGTITVEQAFLYNYGDGQPPANLFPPPSMWNGQTNGFFGLCDIGFVQ